MMPTIYFKDANFIISLPLFCAAFSTARASRRRYFCAWSHVSVTIEPFKSFPISSSEGWGICWTRSGWLGNMIWVLLCQIDKGSTHIVDYSSIVAHSDLVGRPYSYTLSYHSILIIIFLVTSTILFQCAISTHQNSLIFIVPPCSPYLLLITCYTMLPPPIVHSFFRVHSGGKSLARRGVASSIF